MLHCLLCCKNVFIMLGTDKMVQPSDFVNETAVYAYKNESS